MADLLQTIRRLVEPVLHRVKVLAQRGVVRASDDQRKALELDLAVLAHETLSDVERFAHYGFSSRPLAGAEVVVIALGGNRDHPIVVADEDRRHRPVGTLAAGEVCVYAQGGARVYLRSSGAVEIVAPGNVTVSADLTATGKVEGATIKDSVGTMAAFRTAYNSHTHSDPQGGTTGPPVPTA